jgi:prolipoprotein diacylglyceryl transferase
VSSAVASTVLAAIPSPDRGVWYIGPVPIRAYALCIIAGIVLAVWWGERRFVARGGKPGTVTDIAVFAVPFGLIGGRLYHVAADWQTYFGPGGDPVRALRIWEGGLGIWGAIALGAVGAWIGCRRRGVPLPFFADAVAPGIVAAQAVGRIGNWFNQELYGEPTDLPWGLEIYQRVDPATGLADPLGGVALDHTPIAVVHPTFLYELLLNLAVAGIVVWADRRFRLGHGRAFAIYVAGYTAGRFFIEQMRTDYATRVLGDIRINVVVSAVVCIGALLYLVLERRPREVLTGPAAADAGQAPADTADSEDTARPDDEAMVPVAAVAGAIAGAAAGSGTQARLAAPAEDATAPGGNGAESIEQDSTGAAAVVTGSGSGTATDETEHESGEQATTGADTTDAPAAVSTDPVDPVVADPTAEPVDDRTDDSTDDSTAVATGKPDADPAAPADGSTTADREGPAR